MGRRLGGQSGGRAAGKTVCPGCIQGVSSRGKPGNVMVFYFIFPSLEKTGFGKFIKSHGN